MQKLIVWWDSLSVVKRRTDFVKETVVDTVEGLSGAILSVVAAHTTAASNTQTSALKGLASGGGEEEAE